VPVRGDGADKATEGKDVGRRCPLPTGDGVWEGAVHPPEKFLDLDIKMVSSGAFWVILFGVYMPVLHAETVLLVSQK